MTTTCFGGPSTGRSPTASPRPRFTSRRPIPARDSIAACEQEGRIVTRNWDLYDTRHVVYQTRPIASRAAEGGVRLGVSRVLPMDLDRPCVLRARIDQAPGETLLLRGRLEEIRSRLEHGDSCATTQPHDTASRGRPCESHRPARHREGGRCRRRRESLVQRRAASASALSAVHSFISSLNRS